MKLQVTYRCDVCEEKILIDFEKSMREKKLECPNCGVVYDFSPEELANFNKCYHEFLNKMNEAGKKETIA